MAPLVPDYLSNELNVLSALVIGQVYVARGKGQPVKFTHGFARFNTHRHIKVAYHAA